MYRFQIGQLVIIGVDAHAEEQAGVPSIHDLVVAKLDEVRLVLLIPWRHQSVDLVFEFKLLFVLLSLFCEKPSFFFLLKGGGG